MSIDELKNRLPDYAKDIKLNLSNVLSENGSPGLSQKQIVGIALASAFTTHNKEIIDIISHLANEHLTIEEINAAKAAATIMAMNNIYYRFIHSVDDQSFATMPVNLRMNIIGNHGSDKVSFELNSLAASAINGCAKCMSAHTTQLEKAGMSKQGIQSAIRVASVINAAAMATEIA